MSSYSLLEYRTIAKNLHCSKELKRQPECICTQAPRPICRLANAGQGDSDRITRHRITTCVLYLNRSGAREKKPTSPIKRERDGGSGIGCRSSRVRKEAAWRRWQALREQRCANQQSGQGHPASFRRGNRRPENHELVVRTRCTCEQSR